MPIDEMISKGIDEIVTFLNIINDIDKLINALTEDIRGTMEAEGFDCNDYHRWNSHLKYNPMNLTGLYETFTDALRNLEFFVMETLKGYRMLTEPAYIQSVFNDLSKDLRKERRTG